jgi:hypothetical protein
MRITSEICMNLYKPITIKMKYYGPIPLRGQAWFKKKQKKWNCQKSETVGQTDRHSK